MCIFMVKYECYYCDYSTTNKTKIKNHLNRKNKCKINKKININDDTNGYILSGISLEKYLLITSNNEDLLNKPQSNNECKYCNKLFSRKDNMKRHLLICEEKKKVDTVKESMESLVKLLNDKDMEFKKQLEKKDKEHQKQIEELIKKAGIVNHGNITTNIQNNFKLLNYKETDISHLTENDYVKCLEHYNFCVPHLIRKIHFNPKKPENHNIYISNLKNSYVIIYMNNKWKVKNRDETISRMIDDKQVILEKKIQEWVESGIQYPKVMAKFSRYIEKREQNDVINAIKEDIKLMLYNNRNMIIESKKKLI